MTKFSAKYLNQLRCEITHLPSSETIITDAPVDNHGLGQSFSPTDLLASSLGLCMVTVMGIKAQSMDVDMSGTTFEIQKHMAADPRRVSKVNVLIKLPASIDERDRKVLEATGKSCPVAKSLHPDLIQDIEFEYV